MEKIYLNSKAWSKIFAQLKQQKGIYVGNEQKTKKFVRGVLWVLRTGAQWCELPKRYGAYKSVHKRFNAWSQKGVWESLLSGLSQDVDGEWVMIDSTIIRAHPCAAGYEKGQNDREHLGRSKGGFTTKLHILVDALGNCLRLRLTPGQRHDITQAPHLLEGIFGSCVLADKGYDSNAFVDLLSSQQCQGVIPSRKNRKAPRSYDKILYQERNLVERFFRKIKNFRRVFSRFDKQAANYASFIAFAATLLWLL